MLKKSSFKWEIKRRRRERRNSPRMMGDYN